MKQRIVAVLLTLCLVLTLVPAVSAAGPSLEDCVDLDQLVDHACRMFSTLEGHYDSVTPKDSNACSIGFMQWHGEGARILLKMICSSSVMDPISYKRTGLRDAATSTSSYATAPPSR